MATKSTTDLFLTDAQIAKSLGMSEAQWAATARALEKNGLPRRNPLFQNRRCWPAVYDFILRSSLAGGATAATLDGADGFRSAPRRGR